MLLDLPPELLDLIADHLEGDKATLGACCLVSKALKDVVQPVLWRNIRLDDPWMSMTAFARLAAGGLGRHTRSLVAYASYKESQLPPNELLNALPSLGALEISSAIFRARVDISRFGRLSKLRSLRLSWLIAFTSTPSSTLAFRNLISLSLSQVSLPRRVVEHVLQTFAVPSLRVLALNKLQDERHAYLPALPTELLDQLDMLEVTLTDLYLLPLTILEHPTPTLVRLNEFHLEDYLPFLQAARPLHLSVDPTIAQGLLRHAFPSPLRAYFDRRAREFFSDLRMPIILAPSRLLTLWISASLHPDMAAADSLPSTLPPLLMETRTRGVDIHWVDKAEEEAPSGESGFNRAFWRYAKEKKRERQEQQVA